MYYVEDALSSVWIHVLHVESIPLINNSRTARSADKRFIILSHVIVGFLVTLFIHLAPQLGSLGEVVLSEISMEIQLISLLKYVILTIDPVDNINSSYDSW